MRDTVPIDRDMLDNLLIYAARYAMGRDTYAPDEVIAAVRAHPSRHVCEVLIEDVRQYESQWTRHPWKMTFIDPHLSDWLALRDWMRDVLLSMDEQDATRKLLTDTDALLARVDAELAKGNDHA